MIPDLQSAELISNPCYSHSAPKMRRRNLPTLEKKPVFFLAGGVGVELVDTLAAGAVSAAGFGAWPALL